MPTTMRARGAYFDASHTDFGADAVRFIRWR